jgi:hypothetical protein
MEPILPFWFKQRQGKAEAVGTDTYRLTAPNAPREAFIRIRQADNGRWSAALLRQADGPEVAATPAELPTRLEAWEAAFELYRQQEVI